MGLKLTTVLAYRFLAVRVDYCTKTYFHQKKTIVAQLEISLSSVSPVIKELVSRGIICYSNDKVLSYAMAPY